MTRISILILCLCAALLPAQDKQAPASKVQKLSAWPTLKDTDRDRVLSLVGQFKKDAKLHDDARAALVAVGDAAAPLLFQQVTDRPEPANEQIFLVFDKMLAPQHAALMAQQAQKPKPELKRYLILRLCRFIDPDMAPVLIAAMKDKDPKVVFAGALGALAVHKKEGLPVVHASVKADWESVRELTAAVLPAARSQEVGQWVIDMLGTNDAVDRAACLRLMRYVAIKEQSSYMRIYLDHEDRGVKKEAINALRVLNGMPAIENLSVFQAIEMAKEWKSKA